MTSTDTPSLQALLNAQFGVLRPSARAVTSKYISHQGRRECARRRARMGKQERDAAVTTLVQAARTAYANGNTGITNITAQRDAAVTQMLTVSENTISTAQINAINAALVSMGTAITFTTTAVSDAYAAVVTANPALRLSDSDTL